jgi:hypothetical protein
MFFKTNGAFLDLLHNVGWFSSGQFTAGADRNACRQEKNSRLLMQLGVGKEPKTAFYIKAGGGRAEF